MWINFKWTNRRFDGLNEKKRSNKRPTKRTFRAAEHKNYVFRWHLNRDTPTLPIFANNIRITMYSFTFRLTTLTMPKYWMHSIKYSCLPIADLQRDRLSSIERKRRKKIRIIIEVRKIAKIHLNWLRFRNSSLKPDFSTQDSTIISFDCCSFYYDLVAFVDS